MNKEEILKQKIEELRRKIKKKKDEGDDGEGTPQNQKTLAKDVRMTRVRDIIKYNPKDYEIEDDGLSL